MWSLLPGRGSRRRRDIGSGWKEGGGDDSGAYPTRRCHFCNEVSLIVPPLPPSNSSSQSAEGQHWSIDDARVGETSRSSSSLRRSVGTVQEAWYCSSCRCWNRYDAAQIGGMATWDEAMAGAPPSLASPSTTSTKSSRSPFCHTCQTNQTLVLSMLASHDFDDEDEDEEQQERWSAAIQRRYPPLCKACQPMVQARIEEKDKVARQLIYKSLLERQRQRQNGQVLRAKKEDAREGSDAAGKPRHELGGQIGNSARGVLWLLWTISGLLTSLIGITTAHESMDTRHILVATLVCIPVGLFARTYDPSAVLLGSQATHRRIRGLDIWRSNQAYMLVIRAATVLLLTSRSYTWPPLEGFLGRIQPTLFLASLLAQILLLYQGWSSIQLQPLQRIALQSRTIEVDNPDSSSYTTRQASAAASSALPLSLADHDSFQQDGSSHAMSSALDELLQHPRYEAEEMDWTPSPPTKKLSNNLPSMTEANGNDGIMLGPQRFFGPKEVPTGLEDLFGAALALRDEEDQAQQQDDERGKTSNGMHQNGAILREWRAVFVFISFVAVATAVAISSLKWGPEWWEAWKSRANGLQRGPILGFLREMDHERPAI